LGDAGAKPGSRREALHAAVTHAAGAEAPRIWERVSALLDARASAWLAAYRDSCEATNVRHEQSAELMDLRTRCLDDNLDSTRALTDLLTRGDPAVVEHAVEAVASLEDLRRCSDVQRLRLDPSLPKDPATRKRVEELRAALHDADSLLQVGGYDRAALAARAILAEAEVIHYCPLQAEAMVVAGDAESQESLERAEATLERAIERAESCGHDRMVARAATELVWVYGLRQSPLAERSASLARGALARLGGDSRLEAWLANNMSAMLAGEGRLVEAKAAAERAIELKSRASGPEHFDTALSMDNLALILLEAGELDRALDVSERMVEIASRWVGRNSVTYLSLLSTRADVIARLGRHAEAEADLRRVVAKFEDRSVGGIRLGRGVKDLANAVALSGRPREAIPIFERALRLATDDSPYEIADTEFALAKARDAVTPGDTEALALADKAAAAYATTTFFERQRREIAAWKASHRPKRK
jgi:tetratricopeptide (TPR) repeat protein